MRCAQWQIPANMWLVEQLSGTVITGNDPPHMKLNKEDNLATSALPKHCSLRIDDIDVYTRIVSYETKCNRAVEKFVQRAKWVPISHRFDVFK